MFARKPKRCPTDTLACPLCGDAIPWQPCAECMGFGSWDAGVSSFDCVFCGGTGWQSAPHVCGDGDAAGAPPGVTSQQSAALTAGPPAPDEGRGLPEKDTSLRPAAAPLTLHKIVLLLLVLFVLLLVFGTALAGLLINLR
jgi:hypothetical protein